MSGGPPPPIHVRGRVGLGDMDLWTRWEAFLQGDEMSQWQTMKSILEHASPEFRAAAMNVLVDLELEAARNAYRNAKQEEEARRVDLIFAAQDEWKRKVRWFDEALSAAVVARHEFEEARRKLVSAEVELRDRGVTLATVRTWFRRVQTPWQSWAWPGAERGRGVSRYDTPAGVAEVKQEVAQSVRRRQESKSPTPEPAVEGPSRRRPTESPSLFKK